MVQMFVLLTIYARFQLYLDITKLKSRLKRARKKNDSIQYIPHWCIILWMIVVMERKKRKALPYSYFSKTTISTTISTLTAVRYNGCSQRSKEDCSRIELCFGCKCHFEHFLFRIIDYLWIIELNRQVVTVIER